MLTLKAITNFVEWAFVAGFLLFLLIPYVDHYRVHRTLKGSMKENGIGYAMVLQGMARNDLSGLIGIITILFFLCAIFPKVACAATIYFFHLMYLLHLAQASGYRYKPQKY
jgi:hypothetical protein